MADRSVEVDRHPDVVGQDWQVSQCGIQEVAMQVLYYKQTGFAAVLIPWFGDSTSGGLLHEGAVVRLTVVIARAPETSRKNQDEHCRAHPPQLLGNP